MAQSRCGTCLFPGNIQWHFSASVQKKDILLHSIDQSKQIAKPSSMGRNAGPFCRRHCQDTRSPWGCPILLSEGDAVEFEQKWDLSPLRINTHTHTHTMDSYIQLHTLQSLFIVIVPFNKVRHLLIFIFHLFI